MEKKFMERAIELAHTGMRKNQGGPFGCVIVKNGTIIAEGNNRVTSDNDPTAHAEIIAIRKACKTLNDFQLKDCEIYTSCLGAIYWARPKQVFFAATREDAAKAGFDDEFIYEELDVSPEQRNIPMIPAERNSALKLFEEWKQKEDKTKY